MALGRWRVSFTAVASAVVLSSCGPASSTGGTDDAKDVAAVPAGEAAECDPGLVSPPPDLSAEEPFGIVADDCSWQPVEGPGWSETVTCADMWQEGRVLPEVFLGCETPDGSSPMHLAVDCADERLDGMWVYEGLAARDGEAIRPTTAVVTASGTVAC